MSTKKFIGFLLATIMVFSLAGCGGNSASSDNEAATSPITEEEDAVEETTTPEESVSASEETSEEVSEEISATSETPAEQPEYVLTTYTLTKDLGSGYSCEWIVNIGGWVKATDTDTINAAWEAVGGEGDAPEAKDFDHNNIHYSSDTAALIFCSVELKDTTPGDYSIANSSKNPQLNYILPDVGVDHNVSGIEYFPNKTDLVSDTNGFLKTITPSVTSKTWGPIQIVFCVEDVFSPEHPEGDQEVLDTAWVFNNDEIYINTSW